MLFFILHMIFYLLLALFLLVLLVRSLRVNWQRKNRVPIGYLTPVFLSLLFTWFAVTRTIPKLLDLPMILGGRLISEDVIFAESDIGWTRIQGSDRSYTYCRWQFKPIAQIQYRISYTPYSRSIIDTREIKENTP